MPGLTTNIINLISDNLRDRYRSGFPILKELIQNADDAGASRAVFGVHAGFAALSERQAIEKPSNPGRGVGEWSL